MGEHHKVSKSLHMSTKNKLLASNYNHNVSKIQVINTSMPQSLKKLSLSLLASHADPGGAITLAKRKNLNAHCGFSSDSTCETDTLTPLSWLNSMPIEQHSGTLCMDSDALEYRDELDNYHEISETDVGEVIGVPEFTTDSMDIADPNTAEQKLSLLNFVACTLTESFSLKFSKNQKFLSELVDYIAVEDPEFVLKVALYCRRELNIRSTANFLVSKACYTTQCRHFIEKYFAAIVRLPSDWIEVAGHCKAFCETHNAKLKLPCVLRRNMVNKFMDFNTYQLGKYNRRPRKSKSTPKNPKQMDNSSPLSSDSHFLTLKRLIRILHIHSPTFLVMCLLGKKYPESATDYIRAGLEGEWVPSLAGKRMRIPVPETWETVLSSKGNTAASWESLISSGKLPYMAMLRNLRNIITAGVSEETHRAVLRKLTNPRLVMKSKQLPLRFYSAYEVLNSLGRKPATHSKVSVRRETKYPIKKQQVALSPSILDAYSKALGIAVEIAVRNNIPPIRGSTLIICSETNNFDTKPTCSGMLSNMRCNSVLLGLMCASACECSSMFIATNRQDCLASLSEFLYHNQYHLNNANMTILHAAQVICADENRVLGLPVLTLVQASYAIRQRFDTVYVVGPMLPEVAHYVSNCRKHLGPVNAVWSDVRSTDLWPKEAGDRDGWVTVKGITDMVLRYIAEASDKSLLAHVERIDELYGLNETLRIALPKSAATSADKSLLSIEKPLNVWRCCRVFVSSTFRDMHAERDIICGLLLPSIRKYAARELCVHVHEVDLRWGVPESVTKTPKALQMCLEHAANADIFILLIGDRYGWIPKSTLLDAVPEPVHTRLRKIRSQGMSVTEMEYHMMKYSIINAVPSHLKRMGPGAETAAISKRIFAFLRDPSVLKNIPPEYLPEFTETNPKKRERLEAFKSLVKKDGTVVMNNYPAWFNGAVDGRPVVGNLTEFAQTLTRCLRTTLCNLYGTEAHELLKRQSTHMPLRPSNEVFLSTYVNPVANAISPRQLVQLERSFLELDERGKHCHALRVLTAQNISSSKAPTDTTLALRKDKELDGVILMVAGAPGCGKTTHLAALTMTLSERDWCPSYCYGETIPGSKQSSIGQFRLRADRSLVTNRPQMPKCIVLAHFVDGLSLTGLPPKTSLVSVIDDWTDRLMVIANAAANHSYHVAIAVKNIKTIMDKQNTSAEQSVAMLRSKITCFSELLKLMGSFIGWNFVFILDAVDHLQPAISDWLPTTLPGNVRVVISCEANSVAARELTSRVDCVAFTISGLTTAERAAAIRALFGQYGKVLDETSFKNQLSLLVNKRNSEIPLYLRLACDELRLYGQYEQLYEQVKALPGTIPTLVRHIIARVEAEFGSRLTLTTLALLYCSQRPLAVIELHSLLDAILTDTRIDDMASSEWQFLDEDVNAIDSMDVDELLNFELRMDHLLHLPSTAMSSGSTKRNHLPALAFHLLLNNLRPLLAGCGNEQVDKIDDEDSAATYPIDFQSVPKGWIRLRSQEIASILYDILFGDNTHGLSTVAILGYHKPNIGQRSKLSRTGQHTVDSVKIDKKHIHWLLATRMADVQHKIYHFFYAEKMNTVCRLLTCGSFIMAKLTAGQALSLLEDFDGYAKDNPEIRSQWIKVSQSDPFKQRLSNMHQFIATHCHTLMKYPFLFAQLALNYQVDTWITRLGFVMLSSVNRTQKNLRHFICATATASCDNASTIIAPVAVYNPANNTKSDTPSAIAVSPNGQLLVYGTLAGNVVILENATLRELKSLHGHGSAILSCHFIPLDRSGMSFLSSNDVINCTNFCLVTTAQDGSIILWDVSITISSVGRMHLSQSFRLISLTGYHMSAVTSCVWHPQRLVLITAGLDCCVFLWTLPKNTMECTKLDSATRSKLPFRLLRTGSGRVSCVTLRLPTETMTSSMEEEEQRLDVLAIGCWDGTVRIHNMDTLKCIKFLRVSKSAISSVEYSPKGGSTMVTQDVEGHLCLWITKTYSLLGTVHQQLSFPTSFAVMLPCRQGRACFSRPEGRYLIQSGGKSYETGQIVVWNAQLGAALGPWKHSASWRSIASSLVHITAFCTDDHGHIAVVGANDGSAALVCSTTQRIVHKFNRSELTGGAEIRVQAVACSSASDKCVKKTCKLLIALGFSNGYMKLYSALIQIDLPSLNSTGTATNSECHCRVTNVELLHVNTCYSDIEREDLASPTGGTLCLAACPLLVASGGGNGVCNVDFFSLLEEGLTQFYSTTLVGMQSAVTAVDINQTVFVAGTKNRLVRIYHIDREKVQVQILCDIYNAANDWVTALSVFQYSDQYHLLVGSHDHAIRMYDITVDGRSSLAQVADGPGGPITTLSRKGKFVAAGSTDGLVKIWKYKAVSNRLDELSTMDLNIDVNQRNSTHDKHLRVMNVRLFQETTDTTAADAESVDSAQKSDFRPNPDLMLSAPGEEVLESLSSDDDLIEEDKVMHKSEAIKTPKTASTTSPIINLKTEPTCLASLAQASPTVMFEADEAARLRIVVGQELPTLAADRFSWQNVLRFRTYAPLLPEHRATLQGHPESVANGLVAGIHINWEDDTYLLSMTGGNDKTTCIYGGDIRQWRLPTENSNVSVLLQHQGPITCISPLSQNDACAVCLTGAVDGTVLFWRTHHSNITPDSNESLLARAPKPWKPVFQLHFNSTDQVPTSINAICAFTMHAVQHIYVAVGMYVYRIVIPSRSFASLEKCGTITLDELLAMPLDLDVKNRIDITRVCFSFCVTDLCLTERPTNTTGLCDVVVALSNDTVTLLPYCSKPEAVHNANFEYVQMNTLNSTLQGNWVYNLRRSGATLVGLCQNTIVAFKCQDAELKVEELLSKNVFDANETIHFMEPLGDTNHKDKPIFLMVTMCNEISRVKILNHSGKLIAQSEPFVSPVSITAACWLHDSHKPISSIVNPIIVLIATSDGLLHLLAISLHRDGKLEKEKMFKIGLYPTGEHITKLQLLSEAPLQVLTGSQSGQLHVYAIV